MQTVRPTTCVRAAAKLTSYTTSSPAAAFSAAIIPLPFFRQQIATRPQQHHQQPIRYFSRTPAKLSGHGPEYDPPTGWLFGVKPGERYQKEGWEGVMYYAFVGGLVVFAVAYAFKPDTSIQTWALEEARRRLEVEGILEEPLDKSRK